jgi:hypothetical protein
LIGYTDLAGRSYLLTSGSPYRGVGTDGRDLGADISVVNARTSAVIVP